MSQQDAVTTGFDFGTSTTMIADGGQLVPLGADRARNWMPSVVGCDASGGVLAGDNAESLLAATTIRSIKRTITDKQKFVRADLPAGIKDVRADDLMVALLSEALRLARDENVRPDPGTVRLGCPAMWDGEQRRRLLDIAASAGLPVTFESLIDEPVAAGIAWLRSGRISRPGPIRAVVFDMGGGTLDVAVLDVQGNSLRDMAVLAALSIPEAGDAFDRILAADLELGLTTDIDSLDNPVTARAELFRTARLLKLQLTEADEAFATLSRTFGGKEIWYTQAQLNSVFDDQMDRAEQAVAAALRIARLAEQSPGSAYDIARTPLDDLVGTVDYVVLSGGMSHIPHVAHRLRAMFSSGRTEVVFAYEIAEGEDVVVPRPEAAVAIGLAQAGSFGRISMYRPAFDIALEWAGGQHSRTVYHAFTPLVEPWQIARGGSDLRYIRNGLELELPRMGTGHLRVVSRTGAKIRASLGGRSLDGFPVAISEQKFEFSLYPNGRIRLVDAAGTHEGQLEDWHVI